MNGTFFTEVQRVRQVWIWALLAVVFGLWMWQFVQQVVLGIPFGENPAPDAVVVLIGIIPFGAMALIFLLRLETRVDREGIHYRMWPFHRQFRQIRPGEVVRWEVRKYRPVRDYGGWGIRYGLKGVAYNMSGNMGVWFEMRKGKKLLIGTLKPEELRSAMGKVFGENAVHRGDTAVN